MEYKTFKNQAAQGNLLLRRVNQLPEHIEEVLPKDGQHIVAPSRMGHNHVIDDSKNVRLYETYDPLLNYLEVIETTDKTEVLLKHLSSFEPHKPILIPPGIYEIRLQRKYMFERWKGMMLL